MYDNEENNEELEEESFIYDNEENNEELEEEYKKLIKLDINITVEYINDILGNPISREYLKVKNENNDSYRLDIYGTKYCIINTLVNMSDNLIECYSITIVRKFYKISVMIDNFSNKQLGLLKFANIEWRPEFTIADIGYRDYHISYFETHEFGFLGGLRYFQYGYNFYGYHFTPHPFTNTIPFDLYNYLTKKLDLNREKNNDFEYDFTGEFERLAYGEFIYNHIDLRRKITPNQIAVFSISCDENIKKYINLGGMGLLPNKYIYNY